MANDRVPVKRAADGRVINAMSIDVEEFFQVGAFENTVSRTEWESYKSRVSYNTGIVLDLLAEKNVSATFFCLGWVAERHPDLIERIVKEGHELASHGYDHRRVHALSEAEFRADLKRTRGILEDASGTKVKGYRAPSFSIGENNKWALDVLAEEGYAYSSSVFPIQHDHYGMPGAPRFAFRPNGGSMVEIPLTTTELFGRTVPCAGGGYFRLLPYALSRRLISRVNDRENASAMFYFHPWEVDPDQPRIAGAPAKSRFRHYTNLSIMRDKLSRVLDDFHWNRVDHVFLDDASQPTGVAA